jgi:hypothetical protein
MSSSSWPPGSAVRIIGLVKAPQHNGKVGRVSNRVGEDGRIGISLGQGVHLSVRHDNLELIEAPEAPSKVPKGKEPSIELPKAPEGQQRTLTRDDSILRELDGSHDPDMLVLYHHMRDRSFDCFNAAEYTEQMIRYYANGITAVEVVPRKLGANEYFLVCLRNKSDPIATKPTDSPRHAHTDASAPTHRRRRAQPAVRGGLPVLTSIPRHLHAREEAMLRVSQAGRAVLRL